MSEQAVSHKLSSVEEYLKLEEESMKVRHEYVGGMVHTMVGASKRHNGIVQYRVAPARRPQRRSLPRVHGDREAAGGGGQDLLLGRHGRLRAEEGDELAETAPCLVVEVVSPSTESIDRREKMLAYRRIPALKRT